jgi:hypothetical protein
MPKRLALLAAVFAASTAFADGEDLRPQGFSVGLGAGWATPIKVLEPNAVSARFRVGPVTLEPSLDIGGASGSDKTHNAITPEGQPTTEINNVDKNGGFGATLGTDIRYPLMAKGPVDLLLIGGLSFGTTSSTVDKNVEDPNGNLDKSKIGTTTFSVGWGLGLEWFFHHNISFSADVRNPIVRLTNTTSSTDRTLTVGTTKTTTSASKTSADTDYGLVFAPAVRAMFHFYF